MKKPTLFLILLTTVLYSQQPVDLVNPFIDSANSRWFFFTSASRPFGMVNLSPDMGTAGAWESGYRYNEKTINFFSHIHAWQLSGIPVMPTTGKIKAHLGPKKYGSAYSHDNETATPGYHYVVLYAFRQFLPKQCRSNHQSGSLCKNDCRKNQFKLKRN